jgi:hypothetical protein
MSTVNKGFFSFILISWLFCSSAASAGSYQRASVKIQSALFVKVLGFNKALQGELMVYVMGEEEFAGEFRTLVGYQIGDGRLASVTKGEALPLVKPDIIYIGDGVELEKVLSYAEENRIMTISGNPEFVDKGVSLIIAVQDGKPKLIVDTEGSIREGVEWNQTMIKISVIY